MGPDGNSVYWSETGTCIIRKLDLTTSIVSTVAGTPRGCNFNIVGPALASQFGPGGPMGFAFWGNDMIIADTGCDCIKQYSAVNHSVSLLAGTGPQGHVGAYLSCGFHNPRGVAVDASGDIYVADMVSILWGIISWLHFAGSHGCTGYACSG